MVRHGRAGHHHGRCRRTRDARVNAFHGRCLFRHWCMTKGQRRRRRRRRRGRRRRRRRRGRRRLENARKGNGRVTVVVETRVTNKGHATCQWFQRLNTVAAVAVDGRHFDTSKTGKTCWTFWTLWTSWTLWTCWTFRTLWTV